MNRYHDNCCHNLDNKSPVPVNHGRSSWSNAGDKTIKKVMLPVFSSGKFLNTGTSVLLAFGRSRGNGFVEFA